MSKFVKIGVGFPTTSKNGKNYLAVKLDQAVMQDMIEKSAESLQHVSLWKSESKKTGKVYYSVSAPMPDDYVVENNYEKKEQSSTAVATPNPAATREDVFEGVTVEQDDMPF